jgi:hypothetical protein
MTYHLFSDHFADGHAVRGQVIAAITKWTRASANFLDSLSDSRPSSFEAPSSLEAQRALASEALAKEDLAEREADDGEYVVLFEPGDAAPAVYHMHRLPRARGEGLRAVARELDLQSEAVARPVLVSFGAVRGRSH